MSDDAKSILSKLQNKEKLITNENLNALLTELESQSKIIKLTDEDKFKKDMIYYAQKNEDLTKLHLVLCTGFSDLKFEDEKITQRTDCFDDSSSRKESTFTNTILRTQDADLKPITVWEVKPTTNFFGQVLS